MSDEQSSLNEVSTVLWRERQLLELLLFKLEEEQLVLAAGRTRWLTHATREVETVLGEIRRVEVMRGVQLGFAALTLGLAKEPSLRELAECAPGPWAGIFADHRRALLALTAEIEELAKANRDLLGRGAEAARGALAALEDTGGGGNQYTSDGTEPVARGSLGLVNEAM